LAWVFIVAVGGNFDQLAFEPSNVEGNKLRGLSGSKILLDETLYEFGSGPHELIVLFNVLAKVHLGDSLVIQCSPLIVICGVLVADGVHNCFVGDHSTIAVLAKVGVQMLKNSSGIASDVAFENNGLVNEVAQNHTL
jgi:hypothetical protein